MVVVIVFGIGVLMIMLIVFYVLFGDLIFGKSDCLFYVQFDVVIGVYVVGEELEIQLICFDGEVLLCEVKGECQVLMSGGGGIIELDNSIFKFFSIDICWILVDFFLMFEVFMQYGCFWMCEDDEGCVCVVVIFKVFNDKLYQGVNSVGCDLCMEGQSYCIVGVMKEWSLELYFYDLIIGSYGKNEDLLLLIFILFDLKLGSNGNMNCFGENFDGNSYLFNVFCVWLQYWVEMDLVKVVDYCCYLENYLSQQCQVGCFKYLLNVCLCIVMEWLDFNGVVFSDVCLQLWLVLGFLGVCLVNMVGLLLVKFLCCSGEIGVCCVFGVSCGQIFLQCLVEVGVVGVVGGVLGIGLVLFGLFVVCQ